MRGTRTDPIGSRCFNGFNVTRPIMYAVGSPRRMATYACALSCTLNAKTRTTTWNRIRTISWFTVPVYRTAFRAALDLTYTGSTHAHTPLHPQPCSPASSNAGSGAKVREGQSRVDHPDRAVQDGR